ncbi:putative cell wall-binding protein [Leifsonia sp. AK011]|uniref:cell wall-binding repeat-containing protein n=1 Tax=Leifsonia sp. AK011 TaxID=2723075 RepID=UPI0015CE5848|nr:cell wall-binding repeat-containing protein [Leifsonia sp. AK011]NYF11205.1 putative cell wall-binding protein [Leifsonia sp. AK011]
MSSRVQRRALIAITTAIALTFGTILVGAPANAAVGGTVSGRVLLEYGETLPTYSGEAMFFPLWGAGTPTSTPIDDGHYSVSGLEQGDYRVLFRSLDPTTPYADVWLGGFLHESDSTVLTVGASNVELDDVVIPQGGSISGTITSASSTDRGAAAAFLWDPATGEWERYSRWANADSSGNYLLNGLGDGTYLLRFAAQGDSVLLSTEYWDDEEYWSNSTPVVIESDADLTGYNASLAAGPIDLLRIAGANRYATGVSISYGQWDTADAVFIVSGTNFPDALSAGPAAAHIASPLLLTAPDSLSPVVAERLAELEPEYIFIIGGTPTISQTVENQLQGYASDQVVRIAGANRYETSRLIANIFFDGTGADTAYLATGVNFPDALSAGPAAANEHGPVILVPGANSSVGGETLELLDGLGVSKVVIAGGAPSVSGAIEAELRGTDFLDEVYRRAGANRFETSLLISQGSFPMTDGVFFATGLGFPDALAGAALAGHPAWRSPILLVRTNCVPAGVNEEIARLKPSDIYILGGEPTIGQGVVNGVPC